MPKSTKSTKSSKSSKSSQISEARALPPRKHVLPKYYSDFDMSDGRRQKPAPPLPPPFTFAFNPKSPAVDDDKKSVKSHLTSHTLQSKHSATSEIKRQQRELKIQAEKELLELEEQEAKLKAEAISRRKQFLKFNLDQHLQQLNEDLEENIKQEFDAENRPELTLPINPPTSQQDIQNWVNATTSRPVSPANQDPSLENNFPNSNQSEVITIGNTLARAIADGLKQVNLTSTSNKSEKFLARQSLGKDLPPFNGKPEQWLTFINAFNYSTQVCDFSNAENLIRLQKALKGEALSAVECLFVTPANVPKIIDLLQTRFGQKKHIIQSLISKAKEAPKVKEMEPESIVQFSQQVLNLIETLTALNSTEHLQNPQLLEDLLQKLPPPMQARWMREARTEDQRNLSNFSQWIKLELDVACQLSPPKIKEDHTGKGKKQSVYTTTPDEKKKEVKCRFCQKQGHRIQDCRKFKSEAHTQKIQFIKTNKLCFCCLNAHYGGTKLCKTKKPCPEAGCTYYHHPSIHQGFTSPSASKPPDAPAVGQMLHVSSEVNYQILPVELSGPKGKISVYALLDFGSGFTLLDEEISNQLGLRGRNEPLRYSTIGSSSSTVESKVVSLHITNPQSQQQFKMDDVRTFPSLRLRGGSVSKNCIEKWKHLTNLPLPVYSDAHPKILIGLPHSSLIIPLKVIRGPKNSPLAAETPLGWTVFGKMALPEETQVYSINSISSLNPDDELHLAVQKFFSTEDLGVKMVKSSPFTKEEQKAIEIAEDTLRRDGERFEIGLLWQNEDITLPESKDNALRRLKSVEKKLDQDPSYAEKYCNNIQHYIDSGFLKKLSPEEILQPSPRTWYLPHFGVSKSSKPEKLRLVFDAAATSHGVSLNSQLLSGPDILKPLPSVLCKFRERKIGFSADIKEMFHQVKIRKEDRPSQRILWRGMDRNKPPDEYEMQVMTFGATCSPFCAQFVKNKNASAYQEQFPRAVDSVINRHYVDDLLDSCDSVDEASELFPQIFDIQKHAGFHICNWISSSPEFISRIPEDLRSKSQKSFSEKTGLTPERVLGIKWNPGEDAFGFDTNFQKVKPEVLKGEKIPSKREALSLIMSLYDPLGFAAPLVVKAKIILQQAWKFKIGWDDPLPDSLFSKWRTWIEELQNISSFSIPRCYSSNLSSAEEIQLHVFCDASELAMAAVAYFRLPNGETAFVAAKTRVTPLKQLTIPRCELQAALMGARLSFSIKDWHSIQPTSEFFWSDSRTVISWLKMDQAHLKQFVSNRIGEIKELTKEADWNWLSTEENVADEGTRDKAPVSLSKSSRWINGPGFLKQSKENWPSHSFATVTDPEILEMKKNLIGVITQSDKIMDPGKFSKFNRLIRATAYVLRFKKKLKEKAGIKGHLQFKEIEEAEKFWLRASQHDSYPEVVEAFHLHNSDKLKKALRSNQLSKLSLFMDTDGILRMKGRVTAEVFIGNLERNPPLLSSKHSFTKLLLQHHHEASNHHGKDRVINELKQKYCILGLRAAVQKIWWNCQHCKNMRAEPVPPEMAPLPSARLASYQRPFTKTGVDYFGPMEVTIGRRHEKRYGALFTCLTTRAVHMELAGSLSTDSFIMALRRFISRRGHPKDIYSDNGSNFIGAERELKEALKELDQDKISDFCTSHRIQWHFIPPYAPHMGGSWERMVRSVKTALYSTLKERTPKEETLWTLLTEAEHTVNCHPLTYVDSDVEGSEVLTPNHFLLGTPDGHQPPGVFTDRDLLLGKQWRIAMRLSDHFWKRWIMEFLPTLTQRQKWHDQQPPLKPGDLVIMVDSNFPRNSWPKGIIQTVSDAKDGQTRWAWVKTLTGTYKRPATKLILLDVDSPST